MREKKEVEEEEEEDMSCYGVKSEKKRKAKQVIANSLVMARCTCTDGCH